MSTTTSPPTSSEMPPAIPIRKVAPHRRYAKKFLTLPDELLTKISDNVAPEDLPNFRLTCKTLANISEKHFGEKRLAHRRFIFTEYSMRGLVDTTAHPVFGPCIKSIMFGTHWLTDDLHVLMNALKHRNITDNAEAMEVLRMYDERRTERFSFQSGRLRSISEFDRPRFTFQSVCLSRLLSEAIINLIRLGTRIDLGVFDDIQLGLEKKARHVTGYGSSQEVKDLPFVRMSPAPKSSLQIIRDACRFTPFRPKCLVLDLRGEEVDIGTESALCSFLLNANGRLMPTIDAIITTKYAHIGIIPSMSCLEFKQKNISTQDLCEPMYCRVSLEIFDHHMRNAILSAPFRRLSITSCSVYIHELVEVLQAFAATLQIVEMSEVFLWVVEKSWPFHDICPVLCCLRDDLRLQKLTLDNIRAMHVDYSSGIRIAKDRTWTPQEKIRQALDVFIKHEMHAWDYSESEDESEGESEVEDEGGKEDEGVDGPNSWSKREKILRTRAKEAKALALAEP